MQRDPRVRTFIARTRKCKYCATDWTSCPKHSEQGLLPMQWGVLLIALIVSAVAMFA
jgi:hypothetical protein